MAPGGGVELADASLEAALQREVMEELGATIAILRPVLLLEQPRFSGRLERQMVFLCRLLTLDPTLRHGPEFSDPSRGRYLPEFHPLDRAALAQLPIRPAALGRFLAGHGDALPDAPSIGLNAS